MKWHKRGAFGARILHKSVRPVPSTGAIRANRWCASRPTTPSDQATEPTAGSRQEENLPAAPSCVEYPCPESAHFSNLLYIISNIIGNQGRRPGSRRRRLG